MSEESEEAEAASLIRCESDVKLQGPEYSDPPILESLKMESSSCPLYWREIFRAELAEQDRLCGEAKSAESVGRFAATSARVVRQPGLCNPISVRPFFKINDGGRFGLEALEESDVSERSAKETSLLGEDDRFMLAIVARLIIGNGRGEMLISSRGERSERALDMFCCVAYAGANNRKIEALLPWCRG